MSSKKAVKDAVDAKLQIASLNCVCTSSKSAVYDLLQACKTFTKWASKFWMLHSLVRLRFEKQSRTLPQFRRPKGVKHVIYPNVWTLPERTMK